MIRIEILLILIKAVTAIAAFALAGLGLRVAHKRGDRATRLLAAGLCCIGLATLLAVVGGLVLSVDIELWLVESVLLLVGVSFLLVATFDW